MLILVEFDEGAGGAIVTRVNGLGPILSGMGIADAPGAETHRCTEPEEVAECVRQFLVGEHEPAATTDEIDTPQG